MFDIYWESPLQGGRRDLGCRVLTIEMSLPRVVVGDCLSVVAPVVVLEACWWLWLLVMWWAGAPLIWGGEEVVWQQLVVQSTAGGGGGGGGVVRSGWRLELLSISPSLPPSLSPLIKQSPGISNYKLEKLIVSTENFLSEYLSLVSLNNLRGENSGRLTFYGECVHKKYNINAASQQR